ncbi:MATE family efflux transporter [Pandoraea bronchicola]|uniref:Multidrug transporter MatE n=1 Tax=Pandoraea bronchicola TaxID=2508287 RepID=A0A5E5BP28_9BURK|nr:MATE family efflux transporter [Pandoraea bronchicola]VVE87037.1 multidrug transporter MatE [Pandoraea bronchicola]
MTQRKSAPSAPPPPLWRAWLMIAIPMMLTNALQSIAGTADGIYLGHLLGTHAIAAVSAFFPVFFFLLAVVIGLSAGTTVMIGQAWGARDLIRVRNIAGTALVMVFAASAVISVLGGLFAAPLMRALGTPQSVFDAATLNARWMLAGMPIVFLLWLTTSMSRGTGDAVSPLFTLLIATSLSLGLTPAFIFGWGPFPRLGVASAAASTLLASSIALGWMAAYWRRKGHPLAPDQGLWHAVRWNPALARGILRIGVPAAMQMFTMAIAEMALLGMVNRHGASATAAYGAVTQVMSWLQLPVMTLGITASILCAHAIGAGRSERIGAIVRTGFLCNLGLTGSLIVLVCLTAPTIMRGFLTDPAVLALATHLLYVVAWSAVLMGMTAIMAGAMRASGKVWVPTLLGVIGLLGIEVPAAWVFERIAGLTGIWWAYPLAFVAMLVMQGLCYRAFRRASCRAQKNITMPAQDSRTPTQPVDVQP